MTCAEYIKILTFSHDFYVLLLVLRCDYLQFTKNIMSKAQTVCPHINDDFIIVNGTRLCEFWVISKPLEIFFCTQWGNYLELVDKFKDFEKPLQKIFSFTTFCMELNVFYIDLIGRNCKYNACVCVYVVKWFYRLTLFIIQYWRIC